MKALARRLKRRWDKWSEAAFTPWMFYNISIFLLELLANALALVSPKIAAFLKGRNLPYKVIKDLVRLRQNFQNCVVCFISSAGEYEQIVPILERLEAKYSVVSILIFFSHSGIKFAQRRNEHRPYFCAPIDRTTTWYPLFSALRPDACIVVRHELWPAFLKSAQQTCPVFLVDITAPTVSSQAGLYGWMRSRLRRWLYSYINVIMAVEDSDAKMLAPDVPATSKLIVVGDTKYDRVMERTQRIGPQHPDILRIRNIPSKEPLGTRFFVIGSAWKEDLEVACEAYRQFVKARRPARDWRIIVVPHDLSAANLQVLNATVTRFGLTCQSLSKGPFDGKAEVIMADRMGILAELYAVGHISLVGGAFHHRVHNVLEPAAHGLYIACGPRYKTSREALTLASSGLLKVVQGATDLSQWWQQIEPLADERHAALINFLKQQSGASDRVVHEVEKYMVRR